MNGCDRLFGRAHLALPLIAAIAVGCAPGFTAQRPYPAPSAEELFGSLRARQAALRTLNVETRTTSWLGEDRFRATVLALVERTGRLRFEAQITLQGTVGLLVTDGKTFSFMDQRHNIFSTGPACAENVALLIRISLLPHEIASILLGDAPLAPDMKPVGVTWDPALAADVLELLGPAAANSASHHLWVKMRPTKKGGRDIVGVEGEIAGVTSRWRVAYESFDIDNGWSFPSLIRFAQPGGSFDDGVEIKIKDRLVNTSLRDEAFTLAAPPGAELRHVPCRR
jgi:hypothetical protein